MSSQDDSNNDDEITTSVNNNPQQPRAFFIQGLPQDETTKTVTGKQLDTIVKKFILPSTFTNNTIGMQTPAEYRIIFDRNVHRKIRDGAFLLLFESSETAQCVWKKLLGEDSKNQNDDEFIRINIPFEFLLTRQQQQLQIVTATNEQGKTDEISTTSPASFQLLVSWSAGKLRDHFFPKIPFSIRRSLLLDPVATYSLTDMHSSIKMAKLLCDEMLLQKNNDQENTLHNDKESEKRKVIRVCDAFACCGGNAFGFLYIHPQNVVVDAIELDSTRCSMLKQNYEMIFGAGNKQQNSSSSLLNIHQGCALEFLVEQQQQQKNRYDIVFFDPPWGGPTGMKEGEEKETQEDFCGFPNFKVNKKTYEAFCSVTSSNENNNNNDDDQKQQEESLEISFTTLVESFVIGKQGFGTSIVALKLPAEKWCEDVWMQKLVRKCVGLTHEEEQEKKKSRERVFPFLFNFGASVRFLCFVANAVERPEFGVATNRTLDQLVSNIWKFNVSSEFGNRELKPRFFDFEKKRWIELKKWLGSKE